MFIWYVGGGNAGLTGTFKRRFCIFCPALCCSSQGGCSGSWITKQPEMQVSLSPVASPQTLSLPLFQVAVHTAATF